MRGSLFIEELKEADRTPASAVVIPIMAAIVPATSEGDGIDAVGIRLPGEEEKRVLPRASLLPN